MFVDIVFATPMGKFHMQFNSANVVTHLVESLGPSI